MAQTEIVMADVSNCAFCDVMRQPRIALPWYDRTIHQLPGVGFVVVAVGALRVGHVLVVPEIHVVSGALLEDPFKLRFAEYVCECRLWLQGEFGRMTVFEHGGCTDNDRIRSSCIEHAHVQLLPGTYGLHDLHPQAQGFPTYLDSIRIPQDAGYVLFSESDQSIFRIDDPQRSQYIRRIISQRLGRPDEWDYAAFERVADMRETIRRLSLESSIARPASDDADH
jgi:hypothetical protein